MGAAQGDHRSGGARQALGVGDTVDLGVGHASVDRASEWGCGAKHGAGRGHGHRPLSRHVCQTGPRAHCGQQRLIKRQFGEAFNLISSDSAFPNLN